MHEQSPILQKLFEMQDLEYRTFQIKLIPNVSDDVFIGIRTPALRKYAKELYKEAEAQRKNAESRKTADSCGAGSTSIIKGQETFLDHFLLDLPHHYFDENQLHAFIISEKKDFTGCIEQVDRFLPYVDNWATCDQLSPGVFKKNRPALVPYIRKWISSGETYTVRFAIGTLMQHFLDDAFDPEWPEMAARVQSEEYYVKMMIAWYFATALAKQYETVLPYLEEHRLEPWTHNKTIRKAVESYRITPEQKAYLKTLKIPTRTGNTP
jgi:3-methyladenine DNA glycosylase AlkD